MKNASAFHWRTNIRYNDKSFEVKAFNSGIRKGYLLPCLLGNITMEVLAQATRKPNERKDTGIGKEKKKISIFVLLYCLKYPWDYKLQEIGVLMQQLTNFKM